MPDGRACCNAAALVLHIHRLDFYTPLPVIWRHRASFDDMAQLEGDGEVILDGHTRTYSWIFF